MNTLSITAIIAIVALVVFWPFAIIWAANTLFGLGIDYTFWTWLAAMVVMAAFGKTHVNIKKD
jgi:hypothetical protein